MEVTQTMDTPGIPTAFSVAFAIPAMTDLIALEEHALMLYRVALLALVTDCATC